VTLRARWVTLRARWVTLRAQLGDAKSSLGDAKGSLGDAKSSLGDAKSSPRDGYTGGGQGRGASHGEGGGGGGDSAHRRSRAACGRGRGGAEGARGRGGQTEATRQAAGACCALAPRETDPQDPPEPGLVTTTRRADAARATGAVQGSGKEAHGLAGLGLESKNWFEASLAADVESAAPARSVLERAPAAGVSRAARGACSPPHPWIRAGGDAQRGVTAHPTPRSPFNTLSRCGPHALPLYLTPPRSTLSGRRRTRAQGGRGRHLHTQRAAGGLPTGAAPHGHVVLLATPCAALHHARVAAALTTHVRELVASLPSRLHRPRRWALM
jgi:hypothetical protein